MQPYRLFSAVDPRVLGFACSEMMAVHPSLPAFGNVTEDKEVEHESCLAP